MTARDDGRRRHPSRSGAPVPPAGGTGPTRTGILLASAVTLLLIVLARVAPDIAQVVALWVLAGVSMVVAVDIAGRRSR